MRTQELKVGGGTVMWTGEAANRDKLETGLTDLGLASLIPKARTPKAILHDALKNRYADKTVLIRPLEKKDAFTIVTETRGGEENRYDNTMSAEVDDDGKITIQPYNQTEEWMLKTAYDNAAGVVPAMSITRLLVAALNGMHGISLKPGTGGVYWLPERRLERWSKIAKMVEDTAVEDGKIQIYMLRSVADAEAMRTIEAGIIADISADLQEIEHDLEVGGLGEIGLASRVERAKSLMAKLKEYEGVLGHGLDQVKEKIELASDAAAEAILLAAAKAAPVCV